MKFLCDQCKAKYQIADEKVAGKTVRMKCRKCGHMIEVRAAVTETSVSIDFPRDENPAASLAEPVHGAHGSHPTSGAPGAPSAPRPPQKPAPPRTGAALATSFASAARPAPPRPGSRPDHGGLANAFTRSMQKEDEALEMLELHAADEWYVAINGVPVGPVRVAELRRKAATGAVTEDSLVWQEGLEEWRPVKAINELAAVVREAIAGGKVSLATPPPGETRASAPPPPPVRSNAPARPPAASHPFGGAPRSGSSPFGPPSAAPARSNVLPFTARGSGAATAEKLDERADAQPPPAPPSAGAVAAIDPFAVPSSGPVGAPAPLTAPAPFASPAVAPPPPSLAQPAKKGPPWIAIAMVVLAGAFGVTAAIIIFTRPPQQAPQPVVINIPSAQPVATAPPNLDVPPPDTAAPLPSEAPSARPQAMRAPGGPKAAASAPAPGNSAIAALLGNNNGPSPGGPSQGGGGGGGQLTSDQIEGVVRSRQASVKRSCFERIATDKTGTVQVTVTAVVGPSGGVQSATANGNEPMIAKCIEGAVRTWQFPASGGTTTVNIPFKFVRQ